MIPDTGQLVIPAGHARMWRMRAGQRVTITQTQGNQVGDFIAFNAADLTEFLSPAHTRRCINRYLVGKGHTLYTNHREPIVEIIEDTSACTTSWPRPATPIATAATSASRTTGAAG